MIIIYTTSVKVQAGWRQIKIKAQAEAANSGAEVSNVLEINDQAVSYRMSRTGSQRQTFDGTYIASREIGVKKRIGSYRVVSV